MKCKHQSLSSSSSSSWTHAARTMQTCNCFFSFREFIWTMRSFVVKILKRECRDQFYTSHTHEQQIQISTVNEWLFIYLLSTRSAFAIYLFQVQFAVTAIIIIIIITSNIIKYPTEPNRQRQTNSEFHLCLPALHQHASRIHGHIYIYETKKKRKNCLNNRPFTCGLVAIAGARTSHTLRNCNAYTHTLTLWPFHFSLPRASICFDCERSLYSECFSTRYI